MEGRSAEALATIYEAHAPELRRFASSRVRDTEAAEDLVQEAFLRLSLELRSRRLPDNPRAWLYRVIANLIVSQARRAQTAARHAERAVASSVVDETPETHCLLGERRRILRLAMSEVGAPGQVGMLMAADGYSGREIARAIGRSECATRTFLHRSRGKVRRRLEAFDSASGIDSVDPRAAAA